ncbi:hypothetical protein BH09PAT1_BH09PAT1_0610 [soil metagenome]
MIDSVQVILFAVIIILTILLVVLGIQVYFILKEVRNTIDKANKVLSHAGDITENISKPISSLSALSTGIKATTVLSVVKIIRGLMTHDDEASSKKAHKE